MNTRKERKGKEREGNEKKGKTYKDTPQLR